MSLVLLLVLGWCTLWCEGYKTGAPESACESMVPKHPGTRAQTSDHHFVVQATRTNNGRVRVRISSQVGEEFQGFALQARSARDPSSPANGRFSTLEGVSQTTDCFDGKAPMLTHVDPSSKREVVTEWTPSTPGDQQVVFRATVLKTFYLFWTDVNSKPVRVSSSSPGAKESQVGKDASSSACPVGRGCLGLPAGCVEGRSGECRVLLSYYSAAHGKVYFELSGSLRPDTYMAVGFSLDEKMGDDFVTDCLRVGNGVVEARQSWNSGKRNIPGNARNFDPRKYVTTFEDGVTTCSWNSSRSFESNGVRFDLDKATTHLLLAEGPLENGVKSYHRSRLSTPSAVDFRASGVLQAAGVATAIKVHGALMVTAWIGFVSLGVLVARYYKEAWKDTTLCGVKVWFALHRSFMVAALTCMAIAVIVIFVHYEGWNSNNIHAIFGIITLALGFLQPIMAALRPSPDSPQRPLFNWLHFSVGTLAHLLSLVTLFLATTLEPSGLDRRFYWALAVFVLLYLLFHLLLQLHLWKTNLKKNNEINMLNMSGGGRNVDPSPSPKSEEKVAHQNLFRVIMLCIYAVILLAILVTLYVLIGTA